MLRSAIKCLVGISKRTAQVPRLASSFRASRLVSRLQLPHPSEVSTPCMRSLTQHRVLSTAEKKAPEVSENLTPADAWVSILENTVTSPWLYNRPQNPERILERAFTLILQILLALNVPREPEAAKAFFFAFENAPVSSTSDMGRARRAIAILTRIVVDDISSIPMSSSLRQQHPKVFALHDALIPSREMHLRDPSDNVEDWKAFWSRTEAPLFELSNELDTAGFGLDLEKLIAAQEEEAVNNTSSQSKADVNQTKDSIGATQN